MKIDRKEAIRKFKETKVPRGVYSLTCVPSGTVWVGASRNLGATKNGISFMLRGGLHREADVQEELAEHGADAFEFTVIEEFDDDLPAMALNDTMKARAQHWTEKLNARLLL